MRSRYRINHWSERFFFKWGFISGYNEEALLLLNKKKLKHTKVMHTRLNELAMQNYLCPNLCWVQGPGCQILETNLSIIIWSRWQTCKLWCDRLDTQQHILHCSKLTGSDGTIMIQLMAVYWQPTTKGGGKGSMHGKMKMVQWANRWSTLSTVFSAH